MEISDAPAVVDLCMRALFQILPGDDPAVVLPRQQARVEHLVRTDPGGSWLAERDGQVVGCAMALMRERLWGFSLFAVDEDARGRHLGRALLDASLRYGEERGADGWIVLSSEHPGAMRRYALAGFDLHPTLAGVGIPELGNAPDAVSRVESAGDDGIPLADAIGRELRGAGHRPDLEYMVASGARLLTFEDRAFAVAREGNVMLLGARDDDAAALVLWAALVTAPPGATAAVSFITGSQQWAIRTLLDARVPLSLDSPVCVRGRVGPLAPYLPSGAFL